MKIHSGDEVIVIAGKDKGKRGRVVRVDRGSNRVVVEGLNIVVRHLRRNPQNPQAGGRVERPAPIHASNVLLWSEADRKGVRVRSVGSGREKHRVAARSGKPVSGARRRKDKGVRRTEEKEK